MQRTELVEDLLTELTLDLESQPGFNRVLLRPKSESAIKAVERARGYSRLGYTDESAFWQTDIERFYANIKDIALYDYNIIGAEGETYHYEGGTNRTYFDRRRLFGGVTPIAEVYRNA